MDSTIVVDDSIQSALLIESFEYAPELVLGHGIRGFSKSQDGFESGRRTIGSASGVWCRERRSPGRPGVADEHEAGVAKPG